MDETELWLVVAGGAFVAVAVAVYGNVILGRRREALQRLEQQERERQAMSQYEQSYRAHALTCRRCGELSYPLPGTRNRYRCGRCERQFAEASHPC